MVHVDGVECRVDSSGKRVVVGSNLVSNEERDSFTLTSLQFFLSQLR